MKRRSFIKKSSLMAMSISAFGAIHWNGRSFVGDTPTTTDILGPFYRPNVPMRSNLIPPGSKGIPMNLSGTIFKDDGKTPLENALIEIWQCDEEASYDNTSDEYLFRGAIKVGKNAKYEFKTIIPVPYKANPDNEESWRPAHIHVRVSSPSQQDLITQIYFKGGKYVDKDRSSSSPQAVNRILEISKSSSGQHQVTFDIVMRKQFPLDEEVYRKITGLYNMGDDLMIEFIKMDDLLFAKVNGQLTTSLLYVGNNSFEGAEGYPKVTFELLPKGVVKATSVTRGKTYTGEKFLKYNN